MLKKILKDKKGEGYIDTVVLVLSCILVLAFCIKVFPVYMAKQKVDTFATEILREAEILGVIGTGTDKEIEKLKKDLGINPKIEWNKKGKIQLNEEIVVTITLEQNIGLFGDFGSFPITLRSIASGKSEVYWK